MSHSRSQRSGFKKSSVNNNCNYEHMYSGPDCKYDKYDELNDKDERVYLEYDRKRENEVKSTIANLSHDNFNIYLRPSEDRKRENEYLLDQASKYNVELGSSILNYINKKEFASRSYTRDYRNKYLENRDFSVNTPERKEKPKPVDKFTVQLCDTLTEIEQIHITLLEKYNGHGRVTEAKCFSEFIDCAYTGYEKHHNQVFRTQSCLSSVTLVPNAVSSDSVKAGRYNMKSIIAIPDHATVMNIIKMSDDMIRHLDKEELPVTGIFLYVFFVVIILLRIQFSCFNHRIYAMTFVAYSKFKVVEEIIMLAMASEHLKHHFEIVLFLTSNMWNQFIRTRKAHILCSQDDTIGNKLFNHIVLATLGRLSLLEQFTFTDLHSAYELMSMEETIIYKPRAYLQTMEWLYLQAAIKSDCTSFSKLLRQRPWQSVGYSESLNREYREIRTVTCNSLVNHVSKNGLFFTARHFDFVKCNDESFVSTLMLSGSTYEELDVITNSFEYTKLTSKQASYIKYDPLLNMYYLFEENLRMNENDLLQICYEVLTIEKRRALEEEREKKFRQERKEKGSGYMGDWF